MGAAGLLDETLDHELRGIEIRDDAAHKRAHRLDARILTAFHQLRSTADGHERAGAAVDGDDARFVEHHLVVLIDDCIGCAEVDGQLVFQ